MKGWNIGLLAAALAYAGSAAALDFGVMETAEPLEPKHFKLIGYPIAITDNSVVDEDDNGFAVGLGYGLFHGVDLEGQVARFNNTTYYGSDVEYRALRTRNLQFSFGGGVHLVDLERGGSATGLDSTAILTYTPIRRLDLNAAVDLSAEDVNVDVETAGSGDHYSVDNRFETAYFVPGVQYAISRNLDLIGETGLGLNGESSDYVSGGLSWYFR